MAKNFFDNFFYSCKTLEELKAAYKKAVKLYHPDLGGDTEKMKQINADYEERFEQLQKGYNATQDEAHQNTETAAEYIEIINKLLHIGGIEIELCGSWLWISGNTREHKDELKAAGCRWAKNKMMWYWKPDGSKPKSRKGGSSIEEIRIKYGSEIIGRGHGSSRPELA